MTQHVCSDCNHAQALHDVWGICGVLGCRKCHLDLECPRCKHNFGVHTVSDDIVFCNVKACDYLTCYNHRVPDKPLLKVSAVGGKRRPVERLPAPTYEDALPSVYRRIKTVQARVLEAEDTSNYSYHTEQGFIDGN